METDHIEPKGEGGTDDIDNAIPVCFDCHAEIHLYNPAHPRGRKYTAEELRMHRDQWLQLAETSAQVLASAPQQPDVGPLQGLVDELEYNQVVLRRIDTAQIGAPLATRQFHEAIGSGAISLMDDQLKGLIYGGYATIERASTYITAMAAFPMNSNAWANAINRAIEVMRQAQPEVVAALDVLRRHLGDDN
jgi:hypothetical protein